MAFAEGEEVLSQLPIMIFLKEGEPLLIYLIVSLGALGVVLVRESASSQDSGFFIWKVLQGP